jgi:hypothetical protein
VRWWIVWTLFFSTVTNYISRQTFSVLAPLITAHYHLTHTDLSKILGAFRSPTQSHGFSAASFLTPSERDLGSLWQSSSGLSSTSSPASLHPFSALRPFGFFWESEKVSIGPEPAKQSLSGFPARNAASP